MTAVSAAPPRTRGGATDLVQLVFNGAGRIDRVSFLPAAAGCAVAWRAWGAVPSGWAHAIVDLPVRLVLLSGTCAVLSKRLHDLGLAGWWSAVIVGLFAVALTGEAPADALQVTAAAAGLLLTALLAAWPGQARFNRFGPSPRERPAAA